MLVDKSTDLRYNNYNRGYIFFHKYKPKSGFAYLGEAKGSIGSVFAMNFQEGSTVAYE